MWRVCFATLLLAQTSFAQLFPTIDIILPTNGSVFGSSTAIDIMTAPYDPDGTVQVVQFFAGTNLIGEKVGAPFSFRWNNSVPGFYRLRAVAIDNSGRRGFSDYVYVKLGSGFIPVSIARGPYLQLGTPTSMVIRWRTDWLVDSKVAFGSDIDSLDYTAFDPRLTAEHELQLTNLLPGTRYFFTVGTSTNTLLADDELFFQTAPDGAAPTRIWIIGDAGKANANQVNVRVDYESFTAGTHTDVWLMLGDNAYEDGTDDEYQHAVFDMYPSLLRRTVVWPTIGNHDVVFQGRPADFPYLDMFTLPQSGEAGGVPSGTERYYSFDYANIHFICLDSQTVPRSVGSPMLRWLEEDLAATSQDWIIAYWHHPPYTKGTYDSDENLQLTEMRQHAVPLLEQYGVDLVFSGHSHVYERSFLLNGHYSVSSNLAPQMILNSGYGRENNGGAYQKPAGGIGAGLGAVYVVCGCSGEGGATREFQHPAMRVSSGGFGSVVLDVNGLRLDAKFLRVPGEIYDYFTIIKGAPPEGVQPIVQIERGTNGAQVSWPTSEPPFVLEDTDNLTSQWRTAQHPVSRFGRRYVVRDPADRTNRFFRVRSP